MFKKIDFNAILYINEKLEPNLRGAAAGKTNSIPVTKAQ